MALSTFQSFMYLVLKIKNIEKQVYEEVKSSNPDIIDSINNTGQLDEEIEKKLISIIEQFQKKVNK